MGFSSAGAPALPFIRIKNFMGEPLEGDVFEEINGGAKYKIFLGRLPDDKALPDFAKITIPKHHCFVLGDGSVGFDVLRVA